MFSLFSKKKKKKTKSKIHRIWGLADEFLLGIWRLGKKFFDQQENPNKTEAHFFYQESEEISLQNSYS